MTRDDLAAVLDMIAALHEHDGDPHDPICARRALEGLLDHQEIGKALVLEIDSSLAGYAVGTRGYSLEAGGPFLLIDELFVRPEFRGRGYGRALIAALLDSGEEWGAESVELEVAWENEAARRLYERLGFKRHHRFYCSAPLATLRRSLQGLSRLDTS